MGSGDTRQYKTHIHTYKQSLWRLAHSQRSHRDDEHINPVAKKYFFNYCDSFPIASICTLEPTVLMIRLLKFIDGYLFVFISSTFWFTSLMQRFHHSWCRHSIRFIFSVMCKIKLQKKREMRRDEFIVFFLLPICLLFFFLKLTLLLSTTIIIESILNFFQNKLKTKIWQMNAGTKTSTPMGK